MPTPLYTFQPDTVISSAEANANFELLEDCLDKNGDDMEGPLGVEEVTPVTTAVHSLGDTSHFFLTAYLNTLKLRDQGGTKIMTVQNSETLTADRTLSINLGDADRTLQFPIPLASGGTGAALADPNADRMLFWDDSAGAIGFLAPGTNMSITDTELNSTAGAGGGLSISGTDNHMVRMDGTSAIQQATPTIDDSANVAGISTLTHTGNYINTTVAVSTSSGNNNNVSIPLGRNFRVGTASGTNTITGLTDGVDGREVNLINVGSGDLVLAGESASSTAANRIIANSRTIGGGGGVKLIYIGSASRWYYLET